MLPFDDLLIAELEELGELGAGQRPVPRVALQLGEVAGDVQVIKQLLGRVTLATH